jgi:hypothetical protein
VRLHREIARDLIDVRVGRQRRERARRHLEDRARIETLVHLQSMTRCNPIDLLLSAGDDDACRSGIP